MPPTRSFTTRRQALTDYFQCFLDLAREAGTGFILDSETWKAHLHWAKDLGATESALRDATRRSIDFIAGLREELGSHGKPVVLSAIVGPRGDAYGEGGPVAIHEAETYHARQIGWLARTEADMVTATTFNRADEAAGVVRAAAAAGLPVVVSFTVETDGWLPDGRPPRRVRNSQPS